VSANGPLVEGSCLEFDLVRAFPPRTYLFRVREEAAGEALTGACDAVAQYRRDAGGDKTRMPRREG
jgi:hypothetical protein